VCAIGESSNDHHLVDEDVDDGPPWGVLPTGLTTTTTEVVDAVGVDYVDDGPP
jgi:hypothetical protein